MIFETEFFVSWGQVDFNGHMANTAYLDLASDSRMLFFKEFGFHASEFARLMIGPVVRKDEIEYYKELKLLENVKVQLKLLGMSEDGSRFAFRNYAFREDGKLSAKITTHAGWLDLKERKLTAPPKKLLEVMNQLEKTDDFQVFPSSLQ